MSQPCLYQLCNLMCTPIKYRGKGVLYWGMPFLGSDRHATFTFDEIDEMPGNSCFKHGWIEKRDFYVVNDEGMQTRLFRALCQL